jgi:hypothetical protein
MKSKSEISNSTLAQLEAFNLNPTQFEKLKDALRRGGRLEVWSQDGKEYPMVISKIPDHRISNHQTPEKYKWTGYDYREQLKLAKQTRNALLAVLAELHRLHFQAWNKKEPVRFGNSALRSLGFSHHEKIRALEALEKADWITVKWHKRKAPQVTIKRGLSHGL